MYRENSCQSDSLPIWLIEQLRVSYLSFQIFPSLLFKSRRDSDQFQFHPCSGVCVFGWRRRDCYDLETNSKRGVFTVSFFHSSNPAAVVLFALSLSSSSNRGGKCAVVLVKVHYAFLFPSEERRTLLFKFFISRPSSVWPFASPSRELSLCLAVKTVVLVNNLDAIGKDSEQWNVLWLFTLWVPFYWSWGFGVSIVGWMSRKCQFVNLFWIMPSCELSLCI